MTERELSYKITTDSQQATAGIKQFSTGVKRELKATRNELDDTRTAGQRVADALRQLADDAVDELGRSERAADTLRIALGDVADKVDVDQAVTDLRKLGLTFEDIESDAEQLAGAIRHVDETVGAGAEHYGDQVTRAQDTTNSFIGNAVAELPGVGDAFGPLGEAVSQFTEQVLGGEVSLRQLAAAAGPMAAITLGVLAAARVMGEFSARSEFAAEQVDAWTEALRAGGDAAQQMTAAQRELNDAPDTRGFARFGTNLLPFSRAVNDLADDLQRAGLTVEQFNQMVAGGPDAIIAWANAQKAADNSIDTTIVTAAAEQYKALDEAQRAAAVSADVFRLSTDQVATAIDNWAKAKDPIAAFPDEFARIADAMATGVTPAVTDLDAVTKGLNISLDEAVSIAGDLADEQTDAAGSARDLAGAQTEAANAAGTHKQKLDELYARIDDRTSWLNLQGQFDSTRTAVDEAFGAWESGAADAEQQMREGDLALQDLKRSVADYATEVLGLPPSVVTAIVADVDDLELADVEARLADLRQGVDVPVRFKPVNLGGGLRAFAGGTRSAPGGWADTAEGGPELMVGRGVRYVPPGAAVYTAAETRRIMNALAGGAALEPRVVDQRTFNITVVTRATDGRQTADALDQWYRVNGGRR